MWIRGKGILNPADLIPTSMHIAYLTEMCFVVSLLSFLQVGKECLKIAMCLLQEHVPEDMELPQYTTYLELVTAFVEVGWPVLKRNLLLEDRGTWAPFQLPFLLGLFPLPTFSQPVDFTSLKNGTAQPGKKESPVFERGAYPDVARR